MSTPHDLLMAFADGELNEAEKAEFRAHLATCIECQKELAEILQLQAMEREAREGAKVIALPSASWRTTWSVAAAGLLAAGLAAIVLRAPDPKEPSWAPAATRGVEAWVSWEPASGHRPYDVPRAASQGPTEEIPLNYLAKLEEEENFAALGAAWILRGEPRRAIESLSRAPLTAGQTSDLAAAQMMAGELTAALTSADRAIALDPYHSPARFNRALILERMGLLRSAAKAFEQVAGKGWGEEAAERAKALKTRSSDGEALRFVRRTIEVAARGDSLREAEIRQAPAQALEIFTLAVLAAKNVDELNKLSKAAEVLDQVLPLAGAGKHLSYARDSLQKRSKVAPWFAKLVVTLASFQPRFNELDTPPESIGPDPSEFLKNSANGAADQKIAAIFYYRQRSEQKAAWDSAAKQFEPAFFGCGSGWASFTYDWLGGPTSAQGLAALADTITRCRSLGIERNAVRAEFLRAHVLFFSRNLVEAEAAAKAALISARRLPDLRLEFQALEVLFNIARYRHDAASTRAYGEELLELDPQNKDRAAWLHESLATLHLFALQKDLARKAMDQAQANTSTLSIAGAFVLADLYRLDGRDADRKALETALERQREETKQNDRLLIRHIRALAAIRKDRSEAMKELRAIIDEAKKVTGDAGVQSALAYSVSLLALEAGEDGRFEDALQVIAEEQSIAAPDRCVLAVERHLEREVVVAKDPSGKLSGKLLRAPAPLTVPEEIQDALKPCETVVVVARPALHGTSRLLDKSIAFTYAVGVTAKEKKSSGPALYVTSVNPPPAASLAPLAPVPEELTRGAEVLSGDRATPDRVLAAMSEASWVEIHAHGKLAPHASDAAAIALSPDANGAHLLLAERVAQAKLSSAPVVLAACNAAEVRREDLHLPAGLPIAFLRAGAKAVVAGDAPIPDAKAPQFFFDLRRRVEAGSPLAKALRDTRMAWISERGETWVESIVVFEPYGSSNNKERER